MQKFNIGLVFDTEIAAEIVAYAEKFYAYNPSQFRLGETSLAHITLIHFTAPDDVKNAVWQACKKFATNTPTVDFAGITALPTKDKGVWTEISVLKSATLLQLQQDIIDLLPEGINPESGTADLYRPHVTLAHLENAEAVLKTPLLYSPLRLGNVKTHLALGVGSRFEPCIEILAE